LCTPVNCTELLLREDAILFWRSWSAPKHYNTHASWLASQPHPNVAMHFQGVQFDDFNHPLKKFLTGRVQAMILFIGSGLKSCHFFMAGFI